MNHWKNIEERVKALAENSDLDRSTVGSIVRDLAAEVALLARLHAERHEAEQAKVDY